MKTTYTRLGKSPFQINIRKIREHNYMSQEEFANYIGIKRPRLGAWEEGRVEMPYYLLKNFIEKLKINKKDVYGVLFDVKYKPKKIRIVC